MSPSGYFLYDKKSKIMKKQFALTVFCIIFPLFLFSQIEPNKNVTINFFLDCYDCDFDFVRQELSFVSFVRDPKLADVHIFSSESQTGSGGRKYFLKFIGINDFEGQNIDYEYFTEPEETDHATRNGLLKIIKAGIIQYYSKTNLFHQINIDLEDKENRVVVEIIDDPWKSWVFRIEAGTDFEIEERQKEFSLDTEIRAEKVTQSWKTRIEANYETYKELFIDNDEEIVNNQNEIDMSADYIKSLTQHWSAGVFTDYESSTFVNIKNSYHFNTGVEYNIFPWDISNRKVFTFRYLIGANQYDYNDITIYDKLNEILFSQSLELNLNLTQPWGDVRVGLEGRNYFNDFIKYRVVLESRLSVRLTKQLSVYFRLDSRAIHDQLYLPKGNASLEDVLLQRRKLATTYEVDGNLGLSFTFGSIYNNVVNERF